jgi:cytochrome c biogenesis protein CcmG/thiol:disulfide interchange protein DsbE
MRRVRPTLALIATLAALTSSLAACAGTSDQSVAGVVAKSTPLPRLSGPSVQGGHIDTRSLTGRPLVVNVWATWCDPCRREQPALMRLHQRYGDRVGFAGVDYRDDEAAAREWIRQYSVTYASLSDPSGHSAFNLGISVGLPDTYVVDATGTIRFAIFGETNEQQLSGLIDQVIARGSPTPAPA